MLEMFYEEWCSKISSSTLLADEGTKPEELIISKGNLATLLKLLEIEEVIKFNDGAFMLDFYENSKAPFSTFYKELVGFIYKASQTPAQSEEDYARIVNAYTTPAERIIKLLI